MTPMERSPYRKSKLSEAAVRDIKTRYEAGQTGPEIAAVYGVHVSAIYYRLHQRVVVKKNTRATGLEGRLNAVKAVLDTWDDNARQRLLEALEGHA